MAEIILHIIAILFAIIGRKQPCFHMVTKQLWSGCAAKNIGDRNVALKCFTIYSTAINL